MTSGRTVHGVSLVESHCQFEIDLTRDQFASTELVGEPWAVDRPMGTIFSRRSTRSLCTGARIPGVLVPRIMQLGTRIVRRGPGLNKMGMWPTAGTPKILSGSTR